MPKVYAPVQMPVPKLRLQDLIAEKVPGEIAIGPKINWPAVPSFLSNLLTLLDPSGMIGGPMGLTWTPPYPRSWQGFFGTRPKIEQMEEMGRFLEKQYPRLKQATELTPTLVHEGRELPFGGFGQYLGLSKFQYPYGKIRLAESAGKGTLAHEMLHRLSDVDPWVARLARESIKEAPEDLIKTLSKLIEEPIERNIEEFLPYLFQGKYSSKHWQQIPEFPKAMSNLEYLLKTRMY